MTPVAAGSGTAWSGPETDDDGGFVRQPNAFRGQLVRPGSPVPADGVPAEPGRYRLYVSHACPWAHRSVIVREWYGLGDVLGMSVVDPIRDARGWRFGLDPDGRDPTTGSGFLSELYLATDPAFHGRYTVPCLWDTATGRIVSNDFHTLSLQIAAGFAPWARPEASDLYPPRLRAAIDELNGTVYASVNNGVYRAGFATNQAQYERAVVELFATLDELDRRLGDRRYLLGEELTEADVRLFPTLVRFDAVYHGHFKCNLRRLVDYPNLWGYARDLYQTPGFGDTTNLDHIKRHYYRTHARIDPTGIVPLGPVVDWTSPSGRGAPPTLGRR